MSNRGPVEYYYDETGAAPAARQRRRRQRLTSVANSAPISWIASAASEADREVAADGGLLRRRQRGHTLRLVAAPKEAYDLFYGTFCNPILWFLQHSMWDRCNAPDVRSEALHAWEHGYLPVNQAFAEAVAGEFRTPGAIAAP